MSQLVVNWVDDLMAEGVMKKLGLRYTCEVIKTSKIDRKSSRFNHAREGKLDAEKVESIAVSQRAGDPIPRIVCWEGQSSKSLVIAGGNHRDEASRLNGLEGVVAYVVKCTQSEFHVLCRALNVVVGSGSDRALRLSHAADSVQSKYMSAESAAIAFNVSRSSIQSLIRTRQSKDKLSIKLGGKSLKFRDKTINALATVQADSVFDAAVSFAECSKLGDREKSQVIAEAIKLPTEASQVAFLVAKKEATGKEKLVGSPRRRHFLRAISLLVNVIEQYKISKIDDIDVVSEEIEEVRAKCNLIASTMISL